MAITVCDKAYECCAPMELVGHTDYAGSRDECVNKSAKSLGFWAAVIEQERNKGRLAFDEVKARRCLEAFAAASCEAHKRNERLEGCDDFMVPMSAPGAACGSNEACIGGACVGPGGSGGAGGSKAGTCRAAVGAGEACAEAPCGRGLHCSPGNKRCEPRRPDGARCSLHDECESAGCNGRDPDAGTPGTCGLKGGDGTRCHVTSGCSLAGGPEAPGCPALLLATGLACVARWARIPRARRRRRETLPPGRDTVAGDG